MNRLEISDLNFCETASHTQVQGGLSLKPPFGFNAFNFFSSLNLYIPQLEKSSSEEKGEEVVEEFKDPIGDGYGYQMTSKDGKKQLGMATWLKDKGSFTAAFARSTTI